MGLQLIEPFSCWYILNSGMVRINVHHTHTNDYDVIVTVNHIHTNALGVIVTVNHIHTNALGVIVTVNHIQPMLWVQL